MTAATVDSTAETPKQMSASLWLCMTLGSIALFVGLHILLAWRLDLFGIYRDPHGRALITSEHERKAKYLLNQAYVPANFDALIIGASASVNWYESYFTGYRFYNESLEGGDASEERRLVEQALPQGHFKVALIALTPRVTSLHILQDGFDKVTRAEVLGSISSLGLEYDAVMDRIHPHPQTYFPDGSHSLPAHAPPTPNETQGRLNLTQDPEAVEDYRSVVQELMDRGTRIVYVVYPMYGPAYDHNQDVMATYMRNVAAEMPPGPVIDFNTPEYASFRNDANNFIDEIHLSPSGADKLCRMLNARMHEALHDQ
jgi:hypothetical protein